jgi:hypothetical protein
MHRRLEGQRSETPCEPGVDGPRSGFDTVKTVSLVMLTAVKTISLL